MRQGDTPYLIRTYALRSPDQDEKRSVFMPIDVGAQVAADMASRSDRDHDEVGPTE
jgi:hypothetical protein